MRLWSALLLFAIPPAVQAQKLDVPVTLLVSSDSGAADAILGALQHEAEKAVRPANIELDWRTPSGGAPEVFSRIVSVRLRGACTPERFARAAQRTESASMDALGQTRIVDGAILPFVELDCDAVRRFLDVQLQGIAEADRGVLLGRALGRVLAHELYHVLLQTRSHGVAGLAKPALNIAELVDARSTFAGAEERRLSEWAEGEGDSGR